MEVLSGRFTGSFFRSLDAKGRLQLPACWLEELAKNADGAQALWFTAFYGRLVAYLPNDWADTVRQLCSVSFPSPRLANFKTKILGLAEEILPDAQGRIRLSRPLMHEAALEKEIVIVGMLTKFEIWARSRFEAIEEEDVSLELRDLGLNLKL